MEIWTFRRTSLRQCCRCSNLSVHSHSSSILEQQQPAFPPSKRSSPSAVSGTLRSAVPCTWCSVVLAGVLRTEQVIMWWCEVKTVGCMWQHCRPKFVTTPAVLSLVCSLPLSRRRNIFISDYLAGPNGRKRACWLLGIWIWRSKFIVIPLGKTFTRITPFSCKNIRRHKFWTNSVAPQPRHHTIRLSLVWFSEERRERNFRCTAFRSATVTADEEEQPLPYEEQQPLPYEEEQPLPYAKTKKMLLFRGFQEGCAEIRGLNWNIITPSIMLK
jgi:hypothetical protein